MSALSAVQSTRVRRRRKFFGGGRWLVSCTECIRQGNDSELIPTVKMEIRHHIEGSFGNEFRRSIIIAELWPFEVARR